jgi:hypothetical protein
MRNAIRHPVHYKAVFEMIKNTSAVHENVLPDPRVQKWATILMPIVNLSMTVNLAMSLMLHSDSDKAVKMFSVNRFFANSQIIVVYLTQEYINMPQFS